MTTVESDKAAGFDLEAVENPFLAQCFWAYPPAPADGVAPGAPLRFEVVVPPAVSTATGGVQFPLAASLVSWSIVDATTSKPLVAGSDYQVLDGDLFSPLLSVAFAPVAGRTVSVLPTLTLFYKDATGGPISVSSQWTAAKFALAGLGPDGTARLLDTLAKSLALTASTTIVEAAVPVALEVVTRAAADAPKVVTSVVDEVPNVTVRGAIPLDNLVEAILGPITGLLGRAVPGSAAALDEATGAVRRLLAEPLAIPVALEVSGHRVSSTLAPVGTPEIPTFSSTPAGGAGAFTGMVPIGSFQAPFTIASAKWTLRREDGSTAECADLSPGVDFLKSFLIKPDVVPLEIGLNAAPLTTVNVSVTITVSLPGVVPPKEVTLPGVTLLALPLPLPQIGAVFRHAFTDDKNAGDQRVYIVVDPNTAPFLPSLDEFVRLLTRLGSVLNNVVAAATTVGAAWGELVGLAGAVSTLLDKIGRIAPGWIYFQAIRVMDDAIVLTGDWDDKISAVMHIGVPARWSGQPFFCLSDGNGDEYVNFGLAPPETYSSILPNLKGKFSELEQIPTGSAQASNDDYNYNDKMEGLGFGRRL